MYVCECELCVRVCMYDYRITIAFEAIGSLFANVSESSVCVCVCVRGNVHNPIAAGQEDKWLMGTQSLQRRTFFFLIYKFCVFGVATKQLKHTPIATAQEDKWLVMGTQSVCASTANRPWR